jgi:hypothetical protein
MTATLDPTLFVDKRVTLVYHGPDGEEAVVCTVSAANAMGVMVKPKVEKDDIVSIELADEEIKQIKSKSLKVITLGNARQHMADRHGYKVADINGMTEQAAFEFHSTLDHSELGHNHDETKRSAATAKAEKAQAESEADSFEDETDDNEVNF